MELQNFVKRAPLRQTSSTYDVPGLLPSDYRRNNNITYQCDEADDQEQEVTLLPFNPDLSLGPRSVKKRVCSSKNTYWGFHFRGCYHTVVACHPMALLSLYTVTYFVLVLIFAGLYIAMAYPNDICKLGTVNMTDAFLFSAITITTVGYGSNDLFFNGCVGVTIVLTLESLVGFVMNAFLLGMMYTKCQRGSTRKYSVRFSKKVMIRQIRGQWYFLFRVCEMRTSQILEAHIRCYCLRDETEAEMLNAGRAVPYMFQQYPMTLNHPDHELGSPMLLMLPTTVVHRIDFWSPLSHRNFLFIPTEQYDPCTSYKWPDKYSCLADVETNGDNFTCQFCGEGYRSKALLNRHIRLNAIQDAHSCYEEEGATKSMMRCLHVWPEFEKDSNDLHNDTDSSNSEIKSNDNTNHLNFEIDDSTIDFGQCENESRSNCHETKDIKPTATSSSTTPETKDIKPTATSSSAMPETKTKDMTINLKNATNPRSLKITDTTNLKNVKMTPRTKQKKRTLWQRSMQSQLREKLPEVLRHAPRHANQMREQLEAFKHFHILVLLEGVDPFGSCTLQCRKMYTLKDFIFEHDFSPCTGLDVSTGHCTIDFDKFDQYMKVQDDPEVAGILQHK